jgi:hypothetical protein
MDQTNFQGYIFICVKCTIGDYEQIINLVEKFRRLSILIIVRSL